MKGWSQLVIYVFFAQGFEEIEGLAPVDILRRAELEVMMVGVGSRQVTGAHGITVACDIADSDIVLEEGLQMMVLPGGMPGTLGLEHSPQVQRCIDYCAENHIPIGAICAAPSILGHKGLLDGRRATCFPGFEDQLGDTVSTGAPVEIDGDIITARGAGVACEFGLALVEKLLGAPRAQLLKNSIRMRP